MKAHCCMSLALMVAVSTVVGCGAQLATVDGTVTLNGAPVAGAELLFEPEVPGQGSVFGMTIDNGTCTLDLGGRKGFAPGKYKLTVTRYETADGTAIPPGEAGQMMKQSGKAQRKNYLLHPELKAGTNKLTLALETAELLPDPDEPFGQ